jgi:integrase
MAELYQRPGSPFWYAILEDPRKPEGIVRRSTKCDTRAAARAVARRLQEEIDAERAAEAPNSGLRWLAAANIYLAQCDLKQTTKARFVGVIGVVLQSQLGDFDLGTLTHEKLKAFVREMRTTPYRVHGSTKDKRRSDATIRAYLVFMSCVIKHAIEYELEGAPAFNPLKSFDRSMLRTSPIIDRQLRPNQWQEVLKVCGNDEHRRLVTVLVGTGMRTGELMGLSWSELDFITKNIEFGNNDGDRTKSSRSRRVPMLPVVHEALSTQMAYQQKHRIYVADGLVFPSPHTGGPRSSLGYLNKILKKGSGLKTFSIHSLRHTFASWCLQQGTDPLAVRDLLGHSTLSTTTRYARHVNDSVAEKFRSLQLPIAAQNAALSIAFTKETRNEKGKT